MDELREQFLIEGRELAQQAGSDLLALEQNPDDRDLIARVFRAVHTLKGSVGLFDMKPFGRLLHTMEDTLDALRGGLLAPSRDLIGTLLGGIAQAERWLNNFDQSGTLPSDAAQVGSELEAAIRKLSGGMDAGPMPAIAADIGWAAQLVHDAGNGRGAAVAIRYAPRKDCFFAGDDPLQTMRSVPALAALKIEAHGAWGTPDSFDPFSCNLLFLAVSTAPRADVESVFRFVADQVELVEIAPRDVPREEEAASDNQGVSRGLRISSARLDMLAEIVDELVVAKNAVGHLLGQLGGQDIDRSLWTGLVSGQSAIDRLTAQLHRTVVDLRLVPLSPLLRRFPALAREIGDRLGKQVQLTVRGDGLEVDKSIVDGLFEPLMHLVRNAVDHGIEPAADRQAARKSPVANIMLDARRIADSLVIELIDDGRGIDHAQVRRTAGVRLDMSDSELDRLDDEALLELLFVPGFSTASTVSDVSGRGVGMDAVRGAVTAMNGKVTIHSAAGVGTTMRLALPFRVAMTRVVTVDCAGERFGIPIDSIVETVRIAPEQIQPVRHGHAFIWRERVVPLLDLPSLVGLRGNSSALQGLHAMIVGAGDQLAAITVDRFSERFDVLMRPMEGMLSGTRGVVGTALTGDGGVLLILDPLELMA